MSARLGWLLFGVLVGAALAHTLHRRAAPSVPAQPSVPATPALRAAPSGRHAWVPPPTAQDPTAAQDRQEDAG